MWQLYLLVVLTLVSGTYGYPQGAPTQACDTMFPTGHNAPAQTSSSPYRLVSNKSTNIQPNEVITGKIC